MYKFAFCILLFIWFHCKDIRFCFTLHHTNFEILKNGNRFNHSGFAVLCHIIDNVGIYQSFLSYAQLVRTLKDQYRENHSAVTAAQIINLRKRLYLTRAMQVTGIGSLLLCVVSMF